MLINPDRFSIVRKISDHKGLIMALCERSASCIFFSNHKLFLSARQHQFLVATYCQGNLQPRCKRRKWLEDKQEEPPDELLPNGYFIDLSKTHL